MIRRLSLITEGIGNLEGSVLLLHYCVATAVSSIHQIHARSFTSIDARKHILRQEGRCFSCLKKGHVSHMCRQNRKCSQCGGKHHLSICFNHEDSSKANEECQSSPEQGSMPLNPKAEPYRSSALFVDASGTILLQTARAMCFNYENERKRVELRFAFDSGSQRSYVTERACRKLCLKSIGSSVLKITAFGGEEGKDQCCNVVHLGVVSKDGRVQKLSLLTVPIICEPLSGASINNSVVQCDHIDGLELADAISGEDLIEIQCSPPNSNPLSTNFHLF